MEDDLDEVERLCRSGENLVGVKAEFSGVEAEFVGSGGCLVGKEDGFWWEWRLRLVF